MIEVHLYGKLRRFTDNQEPTADAIIHTPFREGDNIASIISKSGIPRQTVGSNIFLNGQHSPVERAVRDGDRLGLFPADMQLLMI